MPTAARTEKLDLRISPDAKTALRRAAEASRQSISEFVLSSAMTRAKEVLAAETRFALSARDWETFVAALDAPASKPHARLARLLTEPSVIER
jgi:uncharacterized protein (DUF1778 family)